MAYITDWEYCMVHRKLLTPPVVPSEPTTSDDIGVVSSPSLDDLCEIMPDVASSLKEVLNYKGNVAEDLMLTFQVSFEEYGKVHTADLTSGSTIYLKKSFVKPRQETNILFVYQMAQASPSK